jgi:hypothetical protein
MIISSAKRPDDRDWFYNGIERSDYMSLPQFKFSFGSKLVNELKTIIKCVLPNSLVAKYKSRKGRLKD